VDVDHPYFCKLPQTYKNYVQCIIFSRTVTILVMHNFCTRESGIKRKKRKIDFPNYLLHQDTRKSDMLGNFTEKFSHKISNQRYMNNDVLLWVESPTDPRLQV
jgi:hypothetical protein